MNDIVIRSASLADMPVIYRFVCELEQEVFDMPAFSVCYEECLLKDNNHYLVATMDNIIVGYLSCHGQVILHHAGLVYELQEMYVDEEFRSNGIGYQLLERLEQTIGKENYKLLEVSSNMRRTEAHRFYLTNGFIQTSYKFVKPLTNK